MFYLTYIKYKYFPKFKYENSGSLMKAWCQNALGFSFEGLICIFHYINIIFLFKRVYPAVFLPSGT